MKHGRSRWMVVVPALGLAVACGGSTFSAAPGDAGGTGDGGGGSSGATSSSGAGSSGGTSSGSSGGASSSGSTSSSGAGSSGASSGGRCDGGACPDGGPPSPCPILLPTESTRCGPAGLVCEYGASTVQDCNTVATCGTSGWQIQGPSGTNCGVSPGPSCPTRYGLVPQGSHCGSNYGLVCDYLEGRCACTVSGGLVPLDASAVATWQCQGSSAAGCPTRRPQLGSTCTMPGLFCDYGACYIPGGTAETCTNGLWVESLTACPAIAG